MTKNYIFKIPAYLTAFSLCESGKVIEYHSTESLLVSVGDILFGIVGDDPSSFKYIFKVLGCDQNVLKLNKLLEVTPGYTPPSDSEITKIISNHYSFIIEISQELANDIKSRMLNLNSGESTFSKYSVEARDYLKYITAIRTKPFLLLAGISGTGKSRIVRKLAQACWDPGNVEAKAHKPSNFEMIQVKPNWHDSSELIGYVSRISGKPQFIAGDFLKFIAKAWENPSMPYFLCLDEMNLAPVEQYFAEYLSVVESRKLQNDGKSIISDPLIKKENEEWYHTLVASIATTETIREQFLTEGIGIPQNLIIVGTVNMDETTYSFSR